MLAAPRDDSPSSLFSPESWTEKGFDGVQRLPAACRAAEATTAEAEHLALAFLSQDADSVVARTLSKAGSSAASLKRQLEDFSARQPKVKGAAPEQPSVGASLLALVRGANNERAALGDEFLSGEHVLIALAEEPRCGRAALRAGGALRRSAEGLDAAKLRTAADEALEKYSRDLTAEAKAGRLDPVIGRDDEVRRAMTVLSRRTKNNPILLGEPGREPGVGKTAIAEGLAQRIAAGDIHTVVGAGKADGAMDAGNLLKPALARGQLRCIGATARRGGSEGAASPSGPPLCAGATTLDEYRQHIEKDAALERRFQQAAVAGGGGDRAVVFVAQPTVEATTGILRGLKERYELHHGVAISDAALAQLRAKQEALAAADGGEALTRTTVGEEGVAAVGGAGVPSHGAWLCEQARRGAQKILTLADQLRQRVAGQDDAVEAVAEAIQRSRAGLSDPDKPTASLMFLGPTGVGKTELAKAAVADALFDSEEAMESVSRLLGAPPGYVGYEEGGQLAEAVRRRPYSVVLFDEVDKAHPEVFNVLLQVLDDGRITDGQGRTVNFKNTIIILTSNVGAQAVLDADVDLVAGERDEAEVRLRVLDELRSRFRPEFLNRLDELAQLRTIALLALRALTGRLKARQISLHLPDDALGVLVDLGWNPEYGARPLKRTIQKELEAPLARALLAGEIRDGDDVEIHVDAASSRLAVRVVGHSGVAA
ncbi:Clp protease [Emiliania huxleyi CCMP1516]|uniref:Clp R domain-containing protein n=2 Tax=Emiliania huxleyi TaxID=2903 RepID=A0A0D3ISL8_EMIH1|nr:Clp protease [Emiliania huxleyi CCMP1516]EOD14253.1 Clp protease [Emiliania huxleyi CCMP1516]|eukprot:XP_005766682.1 Clp protease [Emiliania huxleyi CCMP1516]